jgi:LCP family protein required for cell wall assembly
MPVGDSRKGECVPEKVRRARWKRILLWSVVGLVIVLLAVVGGSYLWFRSEVRAANARADPAVLQALQEKPTTTTTLTAATTPTTTATAVSTVGPAATETSSTTTSVPVPETPGAMNILVIGSDRRYSQGNGNSDTLIVVHVDPKGDFMSILSLPRDLRVDVPGHGLQKINAAYAFGGPALAIRTVKNVTGININHYVEVDFNAFKDITTALGGVYLDIDRRYDDGQIQFAPGYQLLGGTQALQYVRTRHDQNIDFGRMLRQQRFITAVREQARGWDLPFKLPSLIKALFKNVDTDLSANDILKLAYWGIRVSSDRVKQVSLEAPTKTIDGVSYVVASEDQIEAAVTASRTAPQVAKTAEKEEESESSHLPTTALAEVDLGGVSVEVLNGTGRPGQAALAALWISGHGATVRSVDSTSQTTVEKTTVHYPPGLASAGKRVAQALGIAAVDQSGSVSRVTVTLGESFAMPVNSIPSVSADLLPNSAAWKTFAGKTSFALEAPAYLPLDTAYLYGRSYDITVGNGTRPALAMVYRYKTEDQYLGIMETPWLEAPAASAGLEVIQAGTVYTVVGTNGKADHVWWRKNGVLYWVSNTLSYGFDKEELLAVAESMTSVALLPADKAGAGHSTS